MKRIILIFFIINIFSCKTIDNVVCDDTSYIVRKIKKQENNVYHIYVERNDSSFLIVSHFNGKRNNSDIKLKKSIHMKVDLYPLFWNNINGTEIMPTCNIAIDYYGNIISKEKLKVDNVYYSNSLNGCYLIK